MTEETKDWKQHAMTAGSLRAQLSVLPDDAPVIMSRDAEGNGYSPLSSVWADYVYEPDTTWSGQVYGPEDREDEDSYYPEDGTPVVLLGPVN
jgi:hypothetical protein